MLACVFPSCPPHGPLRTASGETLWTCLGSGVAVAQRILAGMEDIKA